MTIHKFSALSAQERIIAFWEGTFIGERHDGEYKIVCKQINGFYVKYLMHGDIYKDMRIFENPDLLQPYLNQMDVKIRQLLLDLLGPAAASQS